MLVVKIRQSTDIVCCLETVKYVLYFQGQQNFPHLWKCASKKRQIHFLDKIYGQKIPTVIYSFNLSTFSHPSDEFECFDSYVLKPNSPQGSDAQTTLSKEWGRLWLICRVIWSNIIQVVYACLDMWLASVNSEKLYQSEYRSGVTCQNILYQLLNNAAPYC